MYPDNPQVTRVIIRCMSGGYYISDTVVGLATCLAWYFSDTRHTVLMLVNIYLKLVKPEFVLLEISWGPLNIGPSSSSLSSIQDYWLSLPISAESWPMGASNAYTPLLDTYTLANEITNGTTWRHLYEAWQICVTIQRQSQWCLYL